MAGTSVLVSELAAASELELDITPHTRPRVEMRSILYAGAQERGVYKSTDGGEHWSEFNNGLTAYQERNVLSLAVDPTNPSTVYVGTFGAGVFVTGPADPAEWAFRTHLPFILLGQ